MVEARGGCVQPLVVGVRVSHCIGLIIHHSVIQRSFVRLISWFVQTGLRRRAGLFAGLATYCGAFFDFSFAVNSCLTLRATASLSTLSAWRRHVEPCCRPLACWPKAV